MGRSEHLLSPEARVAYYRAMAAEALRLAQTAADESQKANYLDIATRWNALAAEVERRSAQNTELTRPTARGRESESNGQRK